jgi:hypothetical protein
MEQVISLDVARLKSSRRNLRTILQAIFQLMRFYLQALYAPAPLLSTEDVPQILELFRLVFDLELGEMFRCFRPTTYVRLLF